jgi:flagellar biosynthetic protein FliP
MRRPAAALWARRRLLFALGLVALFAAGCGSTASDVSVNIGDGTTTGGGGTFALSVQLLVALTVLSVAPSILLLATSFTRIVVALSLARTAIGVPSLPPNQVLVGLAFFLSLFVMKPTIDTVVRDAWDPYQAGTITSDAAIEKGTNALRGFMEAHVGEKELTLFVDLSGADPKPATIRAVPLETLVPAFVVSELSRAFLIGFLLAIPFVVIDLVVASALMSLGMVMVSPTQIALPFKLLLFVMVDGWALLSETIVRGFN